MGYLKLFQLTSDYDLYIANTDKLPNVSYVIEDRTVYYTSLGGKLDPALLEIAGTAIVYDTTVQQLITVAGDNYNTEDYPQDTYIPVGVIIVPASHSEDGVARMMSIKLMGYKDSDGVISYGSYDASNMNEFTNNGMIAWANPDSSTATAATTALIAYYENSTEQFPQAQTQPSIAYDEVNGANVYSTGGTEGICFYTNVDLTDTVASMIGTTWIPDGDTGYGWNSIEGSSISEAYSSLMPSPYNADGTPNLTMRMNGSSMGYVHGKKATDMVNTYVSNSTENNRFDIFEATKIYSTDGTKQGDWYVPSSLELAYFAARMKEIYSTMNKMNPNFDEVFDTLMSVESRIDSNYLASWSSTLFSSEYAWGGVLPFFSASGYVDNYGDLCVFAVAPVRNL